MAVHAEIQGVVLMEDSIRQLPGAPFVEGVRAGLHGMVTVQEWVW